MAMTGQARTDAGPIHVELNSIRPSERGQLPEGEVGVEFEMATARGRRVFLTLPIGKVPTVMSRIGGAAAGAVGGVVREHSFPASVPSAQQPHMGLSAEESAEIVSDLQWLDRQLGENFACMPSSPARKLIERLIAKVQVHSEGNSSGARPPTAWTQPGYAVIAGSNDLRSAPALRAFHAAEWEAALAGKALRQANKDEGLTVAVVPARVQFMTGDRTFAKRGGTKT
ncbi:hypothetical protein RKE25_22245 (plasmid) [Dyella sp. BiH032]|uniref:hypothetical protein n=1 Tax=Dyella sp. BiH032 TaxID=3075430 RepID=UPI002892CA5C|nr:hypothetical protein [Dyella sp. BiH032]WNL48453.1 hypothetical protein RKE25_22245 [Dyella sp. BiH032]